ncbi:MAG TPA: hypothetical protein VEI82_08760 [Myxococcota bacterium]|nr:hypothetical protein [Myxococcota bacterium]
MPSPEDLSTVRALLKAHAIAPPEDDLRALADGLPLLRARIAALHAIECGDGEPAPLLRAREGDGA